MFGQLWKVGNSEVIHKQTTTHRTGQIHVYLSNICPHTNYMRIWKVSWCQHQYLFCSFSWRFQSLLFLNHLRQYVQLKVCVCSIESAQHQKITPVNGIHLCVDNWIHLNFKFHVLNVLHLKFKIMGHIILVMQHCHIVQTVSVHMLKHKFTHTQLEACTCSSVNMHMLKC